MYFIIISIFLLKLQVCSCLYASGGQAMFSMPMPEKKAVTSTSHFIPLDKQNHGFVMVPPQIYKCTNHGGVLPSYIDRQAPCLDSFIAVNNSEAINFAVADRIPNLYLINDKEETLCHVAIHHGKNAMLQKILKVKNPSIDVNAQAYDGQTAAHYAVFHNNYQALLSLCAKKINLEIKDHDGLAPLSLAVKLDRPQLVAILLDKNADVHTQDKFGYQPLHFASSQDVAQKLVSRGASVNARGYFGHTPVAMAIIQKHHQVVPFLLDQKSSIDYRDVHGNGLLCYARTPDIARQLVGQGLDPNDRNKYGHTPLHFLANRSGTSSVMKALIAEGADVDAQDYRKQTPLYKIWGPENAKALIDNGAQVNYRAGRNNILQSVLYRSCGKVGFMPWADTTKALVDAGAKTDGLTAVSYAEKYSSLDNFEYIQHHYEKNEHKRCSTVASLSAMPTTRQKTATPPKGSYPAMEDID